MIDGEIYNHYRTNIKYEDFKKAMLNYISEEIFEQEFTKYQKNNNINKNAHSYELEREKPF